MKTDNGVMTLRRYHPVTGADAEDLPPDLSESDKIEIAEMRRNGAKFYWQEDTDDGWVRVELITISFIAKVTGLKLEIINEK